MEEAGAGSIPASSSSSWVAAVVVAFFLPLPLAAVFGTLPGAGGTLETPSSLNTGSVSSSASSAAPLALEDFLTGDGSSSGALGSLRGEMWMLCVEGEWRASNQRNRPRWTPRSPVRSVNGKRYFDYGG